MVEAARLLLDAVEGCLESQEPAELLGAIVAQDVEIDPDTGEPRIKKGTAKDRIHRVEHGPRDALRERVLLQAP